jgi:RNA polymerase sigma-70 factor (ECF subfamily)
MASQKDLIGQTRAVATEYIDTLFGYALMLTRNRADAEDLLQETYFRAFRAMDNLREKSTLKGWLFTILRNIWLNELRRRKTLPMHVEIHENDYLADELTGNTQDSLETLIGNEDRERVRSAIYSLPVDFREIILLREFEELSYQEIATVLDCPAGTVMSRLGRARAKLRELLEGTTVPHESIVKERAP